MTNNFFNFYLLLGARPPVNRGMHQPVTNGAVSAQIEELGAQLLESKVSYLCMKIDTFLVFLNKLIFMYI